MSSKCRWARCLRPLLGCCFRVLSGEILRVETLSCINTCMNTYAIRAAALRLQGTSVGAMTAHVFTDPRSTPIVPNTFKFVESEASKTSSFIPQQNWSRQKRKKRKETKHLSSQHSFWSFLSLAFLPPSSGGKAPSMSGR